MAATGKMTEARRLILRSAIQYPPSACVVSATGGRDGIELIVWKRNCEWLAANGYLEPTPHGDWYRTEKGNAVALEKAL